MVTVPLEETVLLCVRSHLRSQCSALVELQPKASFSSVVRQATSQLSACAHAPLVRMTKRGAHPC